MSATPKSPVHVRSAQKERRHALEWIPSGARTARRRIPRRLLYCSPCLVALLFFLNICPARGQEDLIKQAAHELISRILPEHADRFRVEVIPGRETNDVFEIESRQDKIVLRGNNGVAIATGLNWYLKYYCQCHYSLKSRQLKLPDPLPAVPEKVRRVSQVRWRYFLNYCCFGYSLPWYDWAQWERLIDWMALNGVNAPLSVTGQEAVWRAVAGRFNLDEKDLREFLPGPPYLPFGWMGCLDGWGGPLPRTWVDDHIKLERQILARERALGMTPVLQAFTGHVPQAVQKRFPEVRLHKVHWAEWDTCMLDPLDPLFHRFATAFLEEQKRLYGTDHMYAADTFIEMNPPSGETNFLAATARAIYRGMADADSGARWVLQGWPFYYKRAFWTQPRIEAFLNAVPDDRMLVLDLYCDGTPVWDKTRGFFGKPWAWCAIQNFGDSVFLGGNLRRIHADLAAARRDPLGANMAGLGFANEGLDYNPIVFDFLLEQAWRGEPVDLDQWVRQYSRRAHGAADASSAAAWAILKDTVFDCPRQGPTAITLAPSPGLAAGPSYRQERLVEAWKLLLDAATNCASSDAYQHDLLAVTRQVLGNFSAELHREAIEAWKSKDRHRLQNAAGQFHELMTDLDELLGAREEYLLGRWLADATKWGSNAAEKQRLEWNARRVITLWGGQLGLRDYSRREWSGMLSDFYGQRWSRFFAALDGALSQGVAFDETSFVRALHHWESLWADRRDAFPAAAKGDTLAISRRLWEKYNQSLGRKP